MPRRKSVRGQIAPTETPTGGVVDPLITNLLLVAHPSLASQDNAQLVSCRDVARAVTGGTAKKVSKMAAPMSLSRA
jgi:hypothetical protein